MQYFYEIIDPRGREMSLHAFRKIVIFALVIALAAPPMTAFAQYPGGGGRGNFGGGRRMRDWSRMFPNGMPTPTAPAAPAEQPKPEDKKDDKDKKEAPKVPEGPLPITRPPAIENPAVLADQRMRVDDKKHEVSFNFQEAPWTFVLDELARVSNMTLDWQTLPGDALNLRSSGKYPLAQARDVINAQLLARGYSMLIDTKGQAINVVNLDNLTTALVPRVAPEDLDSLPPHDLVKVSFHLEWLPADKAVDEFKPMLSPKGKLFPLKTTNRLEAIDAVENLREIAHLLDEEQSGNGNHGVKIFELRYTRAADVVDQLQTFLNLKKDTTTAANAPQGGPREMMAMMQQMQGQQGQQQPAPTPNQQQKPDIRLLALQRNNSVLVNAPPDQMGIIKAAINNIDVRSERPAVGNSATPFRNYRLATLDPDALISMLESVADLDPQTKLESDKKNKTVIAYATPRDQRVIAEMVKNLDGTDRKLHVLRLRKLDADLVAGTIRALLITEEKKQDNNNGGFFGRGRFFGGFGGQQQQPEDQPTTKFRVEADVVANRLLVFSNEIELEQVESMLAQLGEVPPKEGSAETLRVLDYGSDEQLLERLKRAWPSIGKDGNKLIIDVPAKKPEQPAPEDEKAPVAPKKPTLGSPSASNTGHNAPLPSDSQVPLHMADLEHVTQVAQAETKKDSDQKPGASPAPRPMDPGPAERPNSRRFGSRRGRTSRPAQDVEPAETAPEHKTETKSPADASVPGDPIFITQGADGKLVITSRDTRALDQLEELMSRLAPPRKDYDVIYLQYSTAASMRFILDDFFSVEKKESASDQRMRRWSWWDDSDSNKKDDTPRLSQRKPLKFIDDDATNSILVQGATGDVLQRVKDIVKVYDRPEKPNTRQSRITKFFQIKHNKASIITEMIKETYKDLLSANDKALESYNQSKNQGGGRGGRFTTILDFGDHEDDGKMSQGRFKGYLSLAANDTTNSILVSCPTTLMMNIEQTIEKLDQAAIPAATSFQVLKIDRGIDADGLQKKLMDILKPAAPTTEVKTGEQGNQPPGPGQGGGRRGGGGGNGGGGGRRGGGGGGE
jgi:Bacterial type II/III secretion system short domain